MEACLGLARFGRIEIDEAESTVEEDAGESAAGAGADVRSYGLTERELDVLRLLAQGLSNRRIGQTLFITESTAGVHVSNILGKLGVGNRVEAAAIAVRAGLAE